MIIKIEPRFFIEWDPYVKTRTGAHGSVKQHLGRTVASFGHLEEALGKAIFALTATVRYEEGEIQGAFER